MKESLCGHRLQICAIIAEIYICAKVFLQRELTILCGHGLQIRAIIAEINLRDQGKSARSGIVAERNLRDRVHDLEDRASVGF